MVTTVVCITPPHTAGPKLGHTQQIQDYWWKQYWSITFYYPVHLGRSPEAAHRQLKGTQTPSRPAMAHILHGGRTTSYRNGRLHPTRREDHVLHGGKTTSYTDRGQIQRSGFFWSCVVFSLYGYSVQGAGSHKCLNVWRSVFSPSTVDSRDQIQVFKAWWQELLHQFPTV